ncbi:hypothetical protein SAMN05216436_13810 [bacterium A37T11]|nr:hypothetical protein SAMN05216436_13810 [bacterium A37T11]
MANSCRNQLLPGDHWDDLPIWLCRDRQANGFFQVSLRAGKFAPCTGLDGSWGSGASGTGHAGGKHSIAGWLLENGVDKMGTLGLLGSDGLIYGVYRGYFTESKNPTLCVYRYKRGMGSKLGKALLAKHWNVIDSMANHIGILS